MILNTAGAILLVAGFTAALHAAPGRAGVPGAGWFPDPATSAPRRRWWDGRAWTGRLAEGGPPADRGRRFRGRFWGTWVWFALGAVVILVAGSAVYRSTDVVHVIAVASLLAMAAVCWAFYRFVDRQLALDDVVGPLAVAAVAVATAGATLLIAANVNSAIIDGAGISTATATVGVVEEGTKFLVPVALFLLGRYRDPRAGVAIGLASGFGFAMAETTQYAYQTAAASGPDFCGTGTIDTTTSSVVLAQTLRIFTVSPLHWLWTGVAVAIAWRLWHLHGRRGTLGALGGLVMVMAIHSVNDSSSTASCDEPALALVAGLLGPVLLVVMYLVFKAWARRSTPPQLIGRVSRGWTPRHLPAGTVAAAPVDGSAEVPAGRS